MSKEEAEKLNRKNSNYYFRADGAIMLILPYRSGFTGATQVSDWSDMTVEEAERRFRYP